jgi:hypothetical protein
MLNFRRAGARKPVLHHETCLGSVGKVRPGVATYLTPSQTDRARQEAFISQGELPAIGQWVKLHGIDPKPVPIYHTHELGKKMPPNRNV